MKEFISIVINVDTRSGIFDQETHFEEHNKGCRSVDFLIDGVINKQNFFKDFETETIVFVDQHEKIPPSVISVMNELADTLVVKKHDKRYMDFDSFVRFNDINYLHAISLARGNYIAHFDADCMAFTNGKEGVFSLLRYLQDGYHFVSYPSWWSPKPVIDDSFDYIWASTRFFMCEKRRLDFSEIQRCIEDSDYLYKMYGDRQRKCPWMEHILGLLSDSSVMYPPIDYSKNMIFCWKSYFRGLLPYLNNIPYPMVRKYVEETCGGIHYPNDVLAVNIRT